MPEKAQAEIVGWLQRHWFIFGALVVASGAWAQSQARIDSLEKVVVAQKEDNKKVDELKEKAIRMEEHQKQQSKTLHSQSLMLEALLMTNPKARERFVMTNATANANTSGVGNALR